MTADDRDRAETVETGAVAGVVRLLCDARLAVLALATLTSALDGDGPATVLVALALPFSFVPLRSWDRKGRAFARSRILMVSDLLMTGVVLTVLVVFLNEPEFAAVYASATAGLFGVVLGLGWASSSIGALAGWYGLVLVVGGGALQLRSVTGAAAILGLGWAGQRLGLLLRHQAATADELARVRSVEAATEERAHLAREMHDSLAKTVHGIGLLGTALAEQLRRDDSRHEPTARMIELACRDANRDTRSLIGGLRALTLGSLGEAVGSCARRWSSATGIPTEVEVTEARSAGSATIDGRVSWAVVRILDEVLDNVRRHAAAGQVSIQLEVGNEVRLVVEDDGRGMESGGAAVDTVALQAAGHYGLAGIHERAAELRGAVEVDSAPGAGSRVTVVLPRENTDAADQPADLRDREDVTS